MKTTHAIILCLFFTLIALTRDTAHGRTVTFSQERLAYDAEGKPYPCRIIDPARIDGIEELSFDLGRGRRLVVRTNIPGSRHRGLDRVAGTIRSCYAYVDGSTGRALTRSTLLYLFEFDQVPDHYRFRVTCSGDEVPWGEVRLAMVKKGASLHGEAMAEGLAELLYDTLPHELGHDILSQIPSLAHDTNVTPSCGTRWFIEGVCEVLAKGFSSLYAPSRWRGYLARRKVGTVLSCPEVRAHLFHWAQGDDSSMSLESSLYGASMLVVSSWTESIPLEQLLDSFTNQRGQIFGDRLMRMMESDTGLSREGILDHAGALGKSLVFATGDRRPW